MDGTASSVPCYNSRNVAHTGRQGQRLFNTHIFARTQLASVSYREFPAFEVGARLGIFERQGNEFCKRAAASWQIRLSIEATP